VLSASTLDACGRSIDRGDWRAAQEVLASRIRSRPARFVLDPSSAAAMHDEVLARWPAAGREAAERADRLLAGTYDLLGYHQLQCGTRGRVDWHTDPVHARTSPRAFYADVPFLSPEIGDHKIIWELNRHQHWLQFGRAAWLSGDPRYADAITAQLGGWLADNAPFIGVNWASMLEIGFRAISWTWALHALLGTPPSRRDPWLIDMLVALDRQLTHVERHLSHYFSPNTHLTGEALALYVVGTALPEMAASPRWARTGRRVLLDEIDRQILPDGGHAERSTHYQRYTLDFYLLATRTARLSGDEAAARRFEDAALRLAQFTQTIADVDGHLPLIGDDDGGMLWPMTGRACRDVRDSLAVAAALLQRPELASWGMAEEVLWLAGPRSACGASVSLPPASRLLAETGYFVARAADGSHAVLDVGRHGYRNGGHAHADALSLTLSIDGRRLLIDPGTGTYTMDASLRDRMRSSDSHNTVTLDGRTQSLPAGPFHWRSTVDAHIAASWCSPPLDVVEAAHDGYAPLRHRRTIVRTMDAGWLIVDAITGDTRRHAAAAHWHFDPEWQLQESGGRVRATDVHGNSAWLLTAGGATALFRGEPRGPGWCAPVYGQLVPTYTARIAADTEPPFALVTWIGSGRVFASPVLRCTSFEDFGDVAVAVEIASGPRTNGFLVRSAESSRHGVARLGLFETDATVLHYVTNHGDTLAAGWTPECTVARLKGRDLPLSSKPVTERLLIRDADTSAFSRGNPATDPAAKCGAAFAR
jgi:hypothetical protein